MIQKWRNDSLNMKHYDLLKIVWMSPIFSMLKNKKDLENGMIRKFKRTTQGNAGL